MRTRRLLTAFAAAVLVALLSVPVAGQDLIVRGAKVYTMAGDGVLAEADVLVRDGKVAAVGRRLTAPAGVQVIDGTGRIVIPGMVELHSHMATQNARGGGSDRHERGQRVNAGLRILDSIQPEYRWFAAALEGGVTTALITPGSNATWGGQTVIVKTVPKPTVEEMLLHPAAGMKMSMAATRGTGLSEMREWFTKAQEYRAKWERWEKGGRQGQEPKRDLQLEGIARQLAAELVTHAHAQTAVEMQYALAMKREFDLKEMVIVHAFDAWKMMDDLKVSGAGVIYGPFIFNFANDTVFAPAMMAKAGIKVALTMDSASDFHKHMLHHAQVAVRYGMEPLDALRAVTINPAELGHVDGRVGSLAAGKDGDLVVLDGEPLSTFSHVLFTVVEGRVVYERPMAAAAPMAGRPR